MSYLSRGFFAGCLFSLATSTLVSAQQSVTTASISGRVVDSSGAAVAGATLVIRSVERNQMQQTTSSGEGAYRFLSLPVGPYELTVSAGGFAPRVLAFTLRVGDAIELPVVIDVAGLAARVDVETAAPEVDIRRTQIGHVVNRSEIDDLPLNGRNYLDLALLTPGVSRTVQRNTERFAETSAVPGTGISVQGQRNLNNTFIVDGLSANDDAAGLAGTYFSEEVIREFQVVTSGGIAEFGRASAGIINVVTRSGGNEWRGRGYGFFRNGALDARNPLATRPDPLSQAQFGGTLSGPVVHDRTFLFANAERTAFDRTGIITISAPNVAAINGTLDRLSYRGPRLETGEFPTGYTTTNGFARLDHALSSGSRVALRYSLYDVSSGNARGVGGLSAVSRGTRLDARDQTLALNWVAVPSDASVNELRAQATRSRLGAPLNDLVGPAVNISGVASFGPSTTSPTRRDLDVYELSNSFTLQRRHHLLKVGGSLLYERLVVAFPGALQGVYAFSSLANFVAGRYTSFQQAFGEPDQAQQNPNVALFVQDEWHPRPTLTINAGIRYDLQWLEEVVDTDTDNLSPRVGLAFAPGDGRTVVRAAAGLYFDRIPLRALSNALQRDGSKYRVALLQSAQPGAPAFPDVLAAFPSGLRTNVTTIDPAIESGMARQANVQVERRLGRAVFGTAGYLHLTGRQIILSRNINAPTLSAEEAAARGNTNLGRPDPGVANNSQYQSLGRSRYDGLTLSLETRSDRRGTARASYTLSRALDDAGNAFFNAPKDNADVRGDWGPSDNDQRHRFVLSGTTPVYGGLRLAGMFTYASAPPFNVQTGNDRNNDTNANDRPAGVGRNTGRGFDAATLDLRVSRIFHVRGQAVELSLDGFNVLNRTNLLIPNNIFGTGATPLASFGQATAAGDPRQLQIGVKWSF